LIGVMLVAVAGFAVGAGVVAVAGAMDGGNDDPVSPAAAQEPTPEETPANEVSPWLGVLARPSDEPPGLLVKHVVPESPAADAGIERGDVITAMDGTAVTDVEALSDAVQAKAAGDTVTLSVIKDTSDNPDAAAEDVQVTLEDRPDEAGFKDIGGEIGKLFDRFVDGQFRYLDENGNTVTIEVSAGTVTSVSANEIKIDVNGDEGEKTFSIPDGVEVPDGLAVGDRAAVVVKDGTVEQVVSGGFPFLPGLPGLGPLDGQFEWPKPFRNGDGWSPFPEPAPEPEGEATPEA
jgi:membrane-associated protease RseP (regulator of RpoE activity)